MRAIIINGRFVPCYRKADNIIGWYDIITQKFFPGTGTWTKGQHHESKTY